MRSSAAFVAKALRGRIPELTKLHFREVERLPAGGRARRKETEEVPVEVHPPHKDPIRAR